ncbi:MAG TPA: hypothetical protein VMN03_07795 [Burkholderiales bacterium]|nr:hypothetical protein [Burkholderiales bacterium]
MFRGLSRPLGVMLLAVLAASPVARVLCALECRAERTAHTSAPDSAAHCAPPAVDPDLATFELRGFPNCSGCDGTVGAVQAMLRAEAKALAAGLAQALPSSAPDELAAPAGAAAVLLPGSPPLRAPYPLRI